MIEDVIVPKWGLTSDDLVFVGWHCKVGDRVAAEQPLADLETDKAAGELPSPVAGVVIELLANAGDDVKPGQVVGRIETE